MKKLFAVLAILVVSAVASFAQINNASASGTVNVNVAQNAQVSVQGFTGTDVTMPSGIVSVNTTLTGGTTLWLVQNQSKITPC